MDAFKRRCNPLRVSTFGILTLPLNLGLATQNEYRGWNDT
jgi:hypothetical protein